MVQNGDAGFEPTADLLEVVDFAVVHDARSAARAEHRLAPRGGEIQNAESRLAQGDLRGFACGSVVRPSIIRSSVIEQAQRAIEHRGRLVLTGERDLAQDYAHGAPDQSPVDSSAPPISPNDRFSITTVPPSWVSANARSHGNLCSCRSTRRRNRLFAMAASSGRTRSRIE